MSSRVPAAALLCVCLLLSTAPSVEGASGDALGASDRHVLAALPSTITVGIHARTGRVRFLGGSPAAPVMRAAAVRRMARSTGLASSSERVLLPVTAARAFLSRTASLFGVGDPTRDLTLERTERRGSRGSVVWFAQTRGGVPVLGGELLVRLDRRGAVLAAAGEAVPASDRVDTRRHIRVNAARRTAAAWLARDGGVAVRSVTTSSEGLTILDERILGGPGLPGPRLAWSIDARSPVAAGGLPAHMQVLVDARTGDVLDAIERVAEGRDRRVCDFQSHRTADFRCRAPYTRVEGQGVTSVGQVDDAYRLMGVVYAFYRDRFGRDGLDGLGEPMVATVRYCSLIQCPLHNSFWEWGAQQVAFGNGWASADDMVGHEFTHGVLDHEARLFYSYQSGALNEGFADIFGEFIDLTYAGGRDTPGSRWLIGEDLPGGALRDLRTPGRFGDPDRIRSPRYATGSADLGGVHTNSAVAGKAAVLMTDGGAFNGYVIQGLGLDKVALIEYEAMTSLLTSAADYNDLFDALQQACSDLVGSNGISYPDCHSVRQAVKATEMDRQPISGGARDASTCPIGSYPRTTFLDDFEDVAASTALWHSQALHGSRDTWYYPQNPNNDPTWDGTWASSGVLNLFGDDPSAISDSAIAMTRGVKLPTGAHLRFEHGFQFDADSRRRYDGGVVELSVDGGKWRDARQYFRQAGYNGTISRHSNDPLKGRRAFTARSHGWGSSRLDLSSLAGRTVRIRFRVGSDHSHGGFGWYIDDVHIYGCVADTKRPTATITLDDGAGTTTDGLVDISIAADGTGSGVSRLRISNSGTVINGVLKSAMDMPFEPEVTDWSLASSAWGGSGAHGTRHVYVQVRDAAGNWSRVATGTISYP